MTVIKKRCNSIDIFRYVCAVLVVIIHTEPFYTGEYSVVGVFLKDYLARIAVPFFFVVSGYFFFLKIDSRKWSGLKSAWHLIKIYAFWSVPYFLISFWVLHDEAVTFFEFIKKCVLDFLLFGSYYHFWFFPALIFSMIISSVIYKLFGFKFLKYLSIVLFVLGCFGSSYVALGSQIPILSSLFEFEYFYVIRRILMTGLPFLVLGGWLSSKKDKIASFTKCKLNVLLSCAVVVYILEKTLIIVFDLYSDLVNTFALYPLVAIIVIFLLNHPLEGKDTLGQNCRTCANFIYYIHPAFLLIAQRLISAILHITLHPLLMFVLTVIVLTGLGLLLNKSKLARKFLN